MGKAFPFSLICRKPVVLYQPPPFGCCHFGEAPDFLVVRAAASDGAPDLDSLVLRAQ